MLKKKILQLIMSMLLIVVTLNGCSKGESSQKADTEIKPSNNEVANIENIDNDDNEAVENLQENKQSEGVKEFSIYENIIDNEYRGNDVREAFRNPSIYIDKDFTFSGTILKSNTSEDGIQLITMELDSESVFEYGENYEQGTIVKIRYDINAFAGERLVEKDRLAVSAKFKEIKNDEEYGDIAEFDALAKVDVTGYLSSLALRDYFKSIGIDIKSVDLKLESFKNEEELSRLVGLYSASYIDLEKVSIYSTNSDIYWKAECVYGYDIDTDGYGYDSSGIYIGVPSILLYSGEKNEEGDIYFGYKGSVSIESIDY